MRSSRCRLCAHDVHLSSICNSYWRLLIWLVLTSLCNGHQEELQRFPTRVTQERTSNINERCGYTCNCSRAGQHVSRLASIRIILHIPSKMQQLFNIARKVTCFFIVTALREVETECSEATRCTLRKKSSRSLRVVNKNSPYCSQIRSDEPSKTLKKYSSETLWTDWKNNMINVLHGFRQDFKNSVWKCFDTCAEPTVSTISIWS